jgi:general nucleoside transport system permease protein
VSTQSDAVKIDPRFLQAYGVILALLVAMAAGSLLILAFGQSPLKVYGVLLASTWGDSYGIGQTIFKATPLIFTGLSVALAFRAGLFNIGCEGQLLMGCFACALVGLWLPASTPVLLAVPLAIAAAAGAGAALGAIPGALRAYTGSHEVINTIMLNFVASALVLWAGNRFFFVEETTHTGEIISAVRLPGLGLAESAANGSFLLALLAAGFFWILMDRSRRGFELRALGHSPRAAENAGIDVRRSIVVAMSLSGALAGAVGANYVLGYKHYFEEGLGRGMGFMGIAVALLGRNHPIGIVAAALLFGTLSQGGLAVNAFVPKEIIEVLQAVIILAVAITAAGTRRALARAA